MRNTNPTPGLDPNTIHELVARAEEAQSDPETLPALHTSDVVIVNVAGRRLIGRDAFAAAMAEALASPLKDVRTTLEVEDIRYPTPDVAIVSLTKTIHDERPEAHDSALPKTGAMSYVLTRDGADWRIALAQTTPVS